MNLGLLVEGHGEVASAPILVRRLAESFELRCAVRSILRVPRATITKPRELERAVTLLGNKVGDGGAVLVLIDADDDPACTLGPDLLHRAQMARPDRRVGVVLAVREYEAWSLAAAASLRGKRGLPNDLEPPPFAEAIRDAKAGWPTRCGLQSDHRPAGPDGGVRSRAGPNVPVVRQAHEGDPPAARGDRRRTVSPR